MKLLLSWFALVLCIAGQSSSDESKRQAGEQVMPAGSRVIPEPVTAARRQPLLVAMGGSTLSPYRVRLFPSKLIRSHATRVPGYAPYAGNTVSVPADPCAGTTKLCLSGGVTIE